MKAPPSPLPRKGFTLVEILVSLGIVSLLTALIFGATTKARSAADRIEGLSKMKQLGMAIQEYANDNNNYLPGPLWAGQSPWYNSNDERTLGFKLWNYLGAPAPQSWTQEAKALSPRAYEKARPTTGTLSILTQQTLSGVNVWGYLDATTSTPPVKLSMLPGLTGAAGLSGTWAAEDVDQTNPNSNKNAGWYSALPSTPIYKPFRVVLYFDWHAAAQPLN